MKVVEVKNLSYTYPDKTKAFAGINFSVSANDSIGIIGPNGAGKSSLLLSLCGLINAKTGAVKILGKKLTKKNAPAIRKNLSLVFQNPDDQLFMPTVFEDISFGLDKLGFTKNEIKKMVKDSLDELGISHFENRSSHHLSLGEKKKVCIASAMLRSAPIILFDEPTNQFDPGARREFIKLIKDIKTTKIIVSHDMDLVLETCNRCLVINNGKQIQYGNTKDLLSNKDLMENNSLEVPYKLLS